MKIEGDKKSKTIFSFLIYSPFWLLIIAMTAWAITAIYFLDILSCTLRIVGGVLFLCIVLAIFWRIRPFRRSFFCFILLFIVVFFCWLLIPASNERVWQPEVSVLSYADINGDDIKIYNIRNFDYRSEEDFTARYYDKTFSLSKLQTADLFIIYWGPSLIAHTIMSFGFGEQGYVCVSIETRKEEGESYSAIRGFFKQYELIYIVADERDLIRLRTNYRGESVYLYRLKTEPYVIKEVFLDYFKQINQLVEKPKWYNALTHNCTTTIRGHTKPYTKNRPFDWRLLANGYLDEMLYERKVVDTNFTFEELKKKVYINDKAVKLDADQDFSRYIRDGLPGIDKAK